MSLKEAFEQHKQKRPKKWSDRPQAERVGEMYKSFKEKDLKKGPAYEITSVTEIDRILCEKYNRFSHCEEISNLIGGK